MYKHPVLIHPLTNDCFDYIYLMNNDSPKYFLDKTVFMAMKVEETDHQSGYWKDKTWKERLDAAFYLINQLYRTNPQTPIDKMVFTKRKHQDG